MQVRKVALKAINHVVLRGERLDFDRLQEMAGFKPDDKAMARRLAVATLRYVGRSDAVLSHYLKQKPPMRVRNILRLALAEVFVGGTKPHAAVDLAVRIVGSDHRHFRSKGFVNAVLRAAISDDGKLLWDAAEPSKLPEWLAQPLRAEIGPEIIRAIEKSHETEPPLDITPKLASKAKNLAQRLDGERLPNGSLRIHQKGQVSHLPGYREGEWWVQDVASSLAVRLVGNLKGKHVLDLCAAPGGKTLQCCAQGAKVTALDRSRRRLDILEANLRRTRLAAKIVHSDALNWETSKVEPFDIVIVDAPCSATGTIRRHPDLVFRRQDITEALDAQVRLQKCLIKKAFDCINGGGIILYSVCSLLPQEGEEVIRWVKEKWGVGVLEMEISKIGGGPSWRANGGGIRTRPDFWSSKGGMDGFFAAALVKRPII